MRSTGPRRYQSGWLEWALAMHRTGTGGQRKIKYLAAEHGTAALAVMASIKRALDPQNS
jgi:D-lactate dehydrogenase (cytochrome)